MAFFFGKRPVIEKKDVIVVSALEETTREGKQEKAFIPRFLYDPPYGYPRYYDLPYIRYLAQTPYISMVTDTILAELSAIEWDIVPCKGMEELARDEEILHIKNFFENPNSNPNDDFSKVFVQKPMRDLLELNSAILVKSYNMREELAGIDCYDGATFTKNPNPHGFYDDREDIIHEKRIGDEERKSDINFAPFDDAPYLTERQARRQAAYFQYGIYSNMRQPIPFGKQEIIWMEQYPQVDRIYPLSPVMRLRDAIQWLIWAVESDLEYFNDNNVPKGIISLAGIQNEDIISFKEQWTDEQYKLDDIGQRKKNINRVPIVNREPTFTRIEFSASEMQLIEKQEWYAKLVWASYGVTPTELGYTMDAKGSANQIVQSKVFKKKAINPKLRIMENAYNSMILPEFNYSARVKVGNKEIDKQKYRFIFKTFDIDEEREKAEYNKLLIESGQKTINEIRAEEGLDEVEWGEQPPSQWRGSDNSFNINMGQNDTNYTDRSKDAQDTREDMQKPTTDKKSVEMKPFAGYENFAACVRENQDKDDPEAYCGYIQNRVEGKGGKFNDFSKILKDSLTSIRDRIIELFTSTQIMVSNTSFLENQIDNIVDNITNRERTNSFARLNFDDGITSAEKELDMNFITSQGAINYISDYSFDNIQGIRDDLRDKLKSLLQRSIIDNRGSSSITNDIRRIFDISKNRAEAIARTESSRAYSQGRLGGYRQFKKETGTEIKKWILITDDNRTSDISRAVHKKYGSPEKAISIEENFKIDINGKKIDQDAPPFHINERDDIIFIVG